MNETTTKIINDEIEEPYSAEKLKPLLKVSSTDTIPVVKSTTLTPGHQEHYTLREWINGKSFEVDTQIDKLLTYYAEHIPGTISADLENICNSCMHTTIRNLLAIEYGVSFQNFDTLPIGNFYWDYQQLRIKLSENIDCYFPDDHQSVAIFDGYSRF